MGLYDRKGRGRLASLIAVLALALVLLTPTDAIALSTNKATARPNENGGSNVIGGLPTRLTWEGTVDTGEEVTSITLVLPEGGSFAGSSTKVTALEGLNRTSIEGVATPTDNELVWSSPNLSARICSSASRSRG